MLEFFRRKRRRATPSTESWMGRCLGTATPDELEHAQRLLTDCHDTAPFVEPDEDEYELWRAGKLVPFYLTELLNAGGHFGPDVDTACLAEEPAVDRWEVGVEYPNWEQTVALARFLDVRVRDLAHPDAEPRHHKVRPPLKMSGLAILSFEPAAVAAVTADAEGLSEKSHRNRI